MNLRKINPSCVGALVIIIAVSLNGCSTVRRTSRMTEGAVSTTSDEVPKEVKLNEFILGPGDTVEITVYRHDDLKRTILMGTSGKISYPLVGDIQAGGSSIFQLRDRIRDGLSKYIINPEVTIGVMSIQSQKVGVLGEVNSPGLFVLDTPLTAIEAISKAGGLTINAKQKNVLLIRGGLKKPELITLRIDTFLSGEDQTQNVSLRNGDVLYVPATFIENVSRFFEHLARIISPIVQAESGIFIGQQIQQRSSAGASVPAR